MRQLIGGVMIALGLAGCRHSAALEAPAGQRPLFLWQVSKGQAVSHLLGTCHLGIPLDYVLPPPHDAALSGARVVVAEVDLADLNPSGMLSVAWQTDGARLSEQLGPEVWSALARRASGLVPAPMLDHMKPWVVYGAVMVGRQEAKDVKVLDVAVLETAASLGTERAYLETVDEQIALMEGIGAGTFLDGLRELVSGGDAAGQQLLRDACVSGDVGALQALVDTPGLGQHKSEIYEARNEAWVPRLVDHLQQGGAFVAVGAGHMVGRTGLLRQLGRRGFEIHRLGGSEAPPPPVLVPAPGPPVEVSAADLDARVAVWSERLGDGFPEGVCATGTAVRGCIEPDQEACVARVRGGLGMCVDQLAVSLPDVNTSLDPGTVDRIAGCSISGLLAEVLIAGKVNEDPACAGLAALLEGP